MITIIHPSRGRPQQAIDTGKRWIERAGISKDELEYILTLDDDDPQLWNYPQKFPLVNFTTFRSPNQTAIEAINVAAKWFSKYRTVTGNFLIVISDDFDCPENWALMLENFVEHRIDWILKTQDGIQDWVITLPIMDWTYFNRFGYVYHPDYKHAWSDTELTCVAELSGRILQAPFQFTHNHYEKTGKKDAISERADAWFEQGRQVFQQRIRKMFDLPPNLIKGQMTPNFYTRKLNNYELSN